LSCTGLNRSWNWVNLGKQGGEYRLMLKLHG
jgi:hypothetical protein